MLAAVLCCALAGALGRRRRPPAIGNRAAPAAKPTGGKKGKGGTGKRPEGGREGRAAGELKRTGCPTYRAITERKYSSKVRQAARRWKFEFSTSKCGSSRRSTGSRTRSRAGLPPEPARPLFLDPLLSYQRPAAKSIRQARDIALDWIESNPRQFRPGRKGFAWHPKTAADRAGYLGFVTRTAVAAAC